MGDLTSTLARIDQQWKLQQRMKPRSRWQAMSIHADDPTAPASTVHVLEPPGQTRPSCLIVFIGGAGLGQFPHISYNELLVRVSDRLNAAVVVAPYSVGLDHFVLSKQVGELARKTVLQLEDDPKYDFPASLPTYCLTHSLGGKLATIYAAATGLEYEGVGIMAFNNFGFSQTIGIAKEFAKQIQSSGSVGPSGGATMSQLFDLAETFIGAINVDFVPSPVETERIISLKYDKDRQKRTRLFVFDNDKLDSTDSFVQACQGGAGPHLSGLPGGHLTPVYFRFGLDELPEETRDKVRGAKGETSFESVSFGDEKELDTLVEEVCGWILGRPPSRGPAWQHETPQLAAGDVGDEGSSDTGA